jgi:hypothetical protein
MEPRKAEGSEVGIDPQRSRDPFVPMTWGSDFGRMGPGPCPR